MKRGLASGWKVYGLLIALAASEGLVGVVVPPYLHGRGYDYATIGVLVSILGISALAARLPAGAIYRPDRGRGMLALSLTAVGITTLLYPIAGDPLSFGVVRALNGISASVATTVNLAVYMDALRPGRDKARAMGLYGGSLAAGYALGNSSGGLVADHFGYVYAFVTAALFAAVGLVLLFLDRHSPAALAAGKQVAEQPSSVGEWLRGLRGALAVPSVAAISLVAFFLNVFHQVATTFFPLYGVSVGLSLTEIGLIRGSHPLVQVFARPLVAPPISRFGYQRVSYVGMVLLAGILASVPLLHTFPTLFVAIGLMGLVRAFVLVSNTVGVAEMDDAQISRGMSSAIYSGSKDMGSLSGPVVAGAVATGVGLVAMFHLLPPLVTLTFAGLALAARARARPRSDVAPASASGQS